jgi:putative FmdB family regulatory protein
MPIYEYICDDCGTKFEKLVRNGNTVACPGCGESHLSPTLSTFAAHSSSGSSGKAKAAGFPSCAGGMCQTPDICGRN